MSNSENESGNDTETPQAITDDQLPEDLQPGEDNPLAEPLDEDADVEALDMQGGKSPEQSSDDSDDSDHED